MKISFRTSFIHAFALLVFTLATGGAQAQYNYYMSSSFLFNQNNYPPIRPSGYYDDYDDKPSKSRKSKKAVEPELPSARKSQVSANGNPLPYTRDMALSVKLRGAFLTDHAKQKPDPKDDVRGMFEETDMVQIMAGMVQLQGLDSSKLEGITALWYGQAWAIANQKPMPTREQYQGIAAQLRRSGTATTLWNTLSNTEKQTFFEQLVFPLIIQKANYQAYLKKGNTQLMARMANDTTDGLKKIGLDLPKLRLSDKGFEKL
jgi:hypothetical protein